MGAAAAVAGIGVAGSLIGGLAGSKGGQSQSSGGTTSTAPWSVQQPYLQQAYQAAQNVFQNNQNTGPYQGQFVASPNNYQTQAETGAGLFANGAGANLPGAVAGTTTPLLNGAGTFENTASNLSRNGIGGPNAGLFSTINGFGTGVNSAQGPNAGLSSALNSSAINGAGALTNFTNNLSNLGETAGQDPTQRIAADAGAVANSAPVQQSLASTNALIDQQLNEQTLPGLNQAAAAGGSLNSSRAGMAEGMANEGAALAKGNADAQILNNAENTGINSATNTYLGGLNSAINANTSGLFDVGLNTNNVANQQQGLSEFNTGNELNAANLGLTTGLNYSLGNANTELAANGQLGTGVNLGYTGANTAGGLADNNFNLLSGAGSLEQAGEQAGLTNAQDQWAMNTQYPYQNIDQFLGIVSTPNSPSSTSSATTQNSGPGVLGGALGGGLGGIGLAQNLGLFGNNNSNNSGIGAALSGLFGGTGGWGSGGTASY